MFCDAYKCRSEKLNKDYTQAYIGLNSLGSSTCHWVLLCREVLSSKHLATFSFRCCEVCAKQEEETCGGPFGIGGRCETNLNCIIEPTNGEALLSFNEYGVCKRKFVFLSNVLSWLFFHVIGPSEVWTQTGRQRLLTLPSLLASSALHCILSSFLIERKNLSQLKRLLL